LTFLDDLTECDIQEVDAITSRVRG